MRFISYDMDLFFLRDCLCRVLERKRILILFFGMYFGGVILGMCFIGTPTVYGYHLDLCEKYMENVCFSDRNVFLILLEHISGCALLLILVLLSGVHRFGLAVPPAILLYRAYTLGGSLVIFVGVYRVTGVLVVVALFLPIRLIVDAVLIAGTVVSCGRAARFRFCKPDFFELALDFAALLLLVIAACLLETLLLAAIFHPIGNLL